MADLADAILGRTNPTPVYRVADVASLDPLTVLVDGVEMDAINAAGAAVAVGEQVLAQVVNGTVWVTGVLAARPQSGTVMSVVSGVISVEADGRTYSGVPVTAGTATLGATVALLWGSTGVVALAGAATVPVPTPPPPQPAPVKPTPVKTRWETATIDARPVTVCSSRGGAWRSDGNARTRALQGRYSGGVDADNTGWYIYGPQLAVAGAECLSCTVRLVRPRSTGNAAPVDFRLRGHTAKKRGSAPPVPGAALGTAALAWGDTVVHDLGPDIGQQLLDGTLAGVCLVYSGTADYGALLGPTESPLAGQIKIRYRRKVN